jgi:lipopolysaccharide/colanic/teichoic acid biosynthesis glycosyltransferase
VPKKIELSLKYNEKANLWRDLRVIFQTLIPTATAETSSGTSTGGVR